MYTRACITNYIYIDKRICACVVAICLFSFCLCSFHLTWQRGQGGQGAAVCWNTEPVLRLPRANYFGRDPMRAQMESAGRSSSQLPGLHRPL